MIKAALSASFLTPEVHLSRGEDAFVAGLAPALSELGVGRHEIAEAYRAASAAWADFRGRMVDAGREVLDGASRAVVVIGKPYNVLDPYLNLNLMQHLRRLGVTALPMWYLPIEEVELDGPSDRLPWHLNRMMVRAVRYCQRDDRLFPVLVSNFGCGPDAFTQMILAPMLDGRPSLVLEFDEHRAEAGLVTRLEAFLDEIEGPRRPWVHGARPAPIAAFEPDAGTLPVSTREPSSWSARTSDVQSFVIPYFSEHAYAYSARCGPRAIEPACSRFPRRRFGCLARRARRGRNATPIACSPATS